jgi:exportin-2 (importin alpha re-exporter)
MFLSPEYITFFYDVAIKTSVINLNTAIMSPEFALMMNNKNYDALDQLINPVHLSFILRFLFYFRNYIDKLQIIEMCKIFSSLLVSPRQALRLTICRTIEALLQIPVAISDSIIQQSRSNYFNKTNVEPQIQNVLQNLYTTVMEAKIDLYSLRLLNVIINIMQVRIHSLSSLTLNATL